MITPELGFAVASDAAAFGWLLLAASLVAPARWRTLLRWLGGRLLPALLAVGYVAALFAWRGEAHGRGGFGSLAEVATLFSVPGLLLGGWIHYLAFDLLVGRWEIDDSASHGRTGLRAWWLWPCLALTFLLGPAGWLLYMSARTLAQSLDTTPKAAR